MFVKSQLKNKKHYQQISMRRTSQKSFGNRQDEKMKETKSREQIESVTYFMFGQSRKKEGIKIIIIDCNN